MRPTARTLACAVALCLLAPLVPADAPFLPHAPLALERGATGLGLALRRVGTTGRVLYVTAHPDDEHNGLLVRLARGMGIRTLLLSVTRGEGGQNAIGPELFEALGVLRTAELDAMHRFDGAEQAYGRAYEFGYSFSAEETLAKWGREETLGDVVRVLRAFRPDVVLTLPSEGAGGGQHHQAVGRLAREAFRAAGDPSRFPGQLNAGLRPWQARKLYVAAVGGFGAPAGETLRVATGVYDPLLGETWQQLGSRARAMHRSQGMSQLVADPGPAHAAFARVDAVPPIAGEERDLFDGIDVSLAGLARFAPSPGLRAALEALSAQALAARSAFDAQSPRDAVSPLAATLGSLRALAARLDTFVPDALARAEVADRLAEEQADVERALALAQGVVLEAHASDGVVVPGQTFELAVSLWNPGGLALPLDAVELELPPGWTAARQSGEPGEVAPGTGRTHAFEVTVAPDARPSSPYWRRAGDRDRHSLLSAADETRPWSPPPVVAVARCRIGGAEVGLRVAAAWRYPGPFVGGERRHEVQVAPELSLRVSPEIVPNALAAPARPIEVRAFARQLAPGTGEATLRLEAPPGWTVTPASAPLVFANEGDEAGARFAVVPPASAQPGTVTLEAVATRGGRESRAQVQVVDYDHVERRQLLRPAAVRVLSLDVATRSGARVGYVMGSGDAVADAIRELGVPTTMLSADDLAFGDLSRFTTVVTGIRAYETRPDLRAAHGRLMRWVEAGGHLVVQYNRDAFNHVSPSAAGRAETPSSPYVPFPARVTPARVSDENAPMRALAPEHPLLTTPNRIGQADWQGWVQERGIQLLDARDPRYVELLASEDPFPYNAGERRGLLVDAAVGRGSWTYVGLVLFRQVPAGVPGGWRLLANLVSR